jgi:glycosyltransferase involved in cell wall biosynthesis
MTAGKTILLITNAAKFMTTLRLPFLKELMKRDYNIILAVPYDKDSFEKLQKLNIKLVPFEMTQKGMNPFVEFACWLRMRKIIRSYKPDFCVFYTIKPNIYGSLAARFSKIKYFASITGLGYVFTGNTTIHKILQFFIKRLYKVALKDSERVIFSNPDDSHYFLTQKIISADKSCVINGEGIDLDAYPFTKANIEAPISFLLLARLIKDKGIYEFVEAARFLKKKYKNVEFSIGGNIDNNPTAIKQSELDNWINEGVINYLGYLTDVRDAIKASTVFVLPSYREGLPTSVLEAMSMGRAIITTDAPGCRETINDGVGGYLVPVRNAEKLTEAMEKFIADPTLAIRMGQESRRIAEEKFDVRKINQIILKAMQII